MGTWTQVPAGEGDALGALRRLLRDLLEKGLVDALLVPRPGPAGDSLVAVLTDRAETLDRADPVAPVMPVQSARIVAALTGGGAPYRLGAVLKACELRATVELAKLKQVDLSGVVLIGVDCLGTYEVSDYAGLVAAGHDPTARALEAAAAGQVAPTGGAQFRVACQMCEQPLPFAGGPRGLSGGAVEREGQGATVGGWLQVALLGTEGQVLVGGAEELLGALGYPAAPLPAAREQAVRALLEARTATCDRLLGQARERLCDGAGLINELSRCIRCHNCMVNCPICYCKECIFRTATFDHPPAQYRTWLRRRGTVRLPADTLLFHLTRLNHMATSCVGCGLCSSACPVGLPVATIFRAVAGEVQALFGYVPGRSLDDELPLATFREDELPGVGR